MPKKKNNKKEEGFVAWMMKDKIPEAFYVASMIILSVIILSIVGILYFITWWARLTK